jgi:hypothetical protein
MAKPTKPRAENAEMIVARVNARAPERIEGIAINNLAHPIANWAPGVYWPAVARDSPTAAILAEVVAELRREFDISD